jgi:hypothetical protein
MHMHTGSRLGELEVKIEKCEILVSMLMLLGGRGRLASG